MPRKVRDSSLDSRDARRRLKVRGRPYFRSVGPKLHLGYRRLSDNPGTWWARRFLGGTGDGAYIIEPIGSADDYEEADDALVLNFWQAVEKAQKLNRPVANGPLTVEKALVKYFEYLRHEGKSSRDAEYRAQAYILPDLGHYRLSALTAEMLRKWLDAMVRAPPRARTKNGEKQQYRNMKDDAEALRRRRASANRILTILKAALNYAFSDTKNKIETDREWRTVRPFKGVDAARLRYLSTDEAQRLINASDAELRPLVLAALQSGCRYGELTRLTVADFQVGMQRQHDGTTCEIGTLSIQQSKSRKVRKVFLTEEGIELFRQLTAGRDGEELILRKNNGEQWGPSHQRRPILAACERARIKPAISFHILRHTWASLAVMAGVPLLVVARNLGHVDCRMCEMHYSHLAPSYIIDAIRAGAPRFGNEPSAVTTLR